MSIDITFFGHSGFLISAGEHSVAIDPFLTGNPVAVHKPSDLHPTHIVLSHAHADHFGDCVELCKANGAPIFAAFEITEYLGEQGIADTQPMNPGGKVTTEFGFVALTQAFHSSSYEGRYMGMPCGVILNINGVTIYHCGDTGLFSDMKLIGELYKPDIACIPIGDRFTMGPELATKAAELIGAPIAVPIHYNTWPPIEQNPSNFKPKGVEVKVMTPGECWNVG
jgi:L-ascorbate metabolism protein UlaG (beta-lactamase superfamily)